MIGKIVTAGSAFALIFGAATFASAMEEQKLAPPSQQTQPEAAAPTAGQMGVQDTTQARKSEGGTVIRIPGIGTLGTLPKMDFGLELLYGATEDNSSARAAPDSGLDENQDLMIRGSVKHKF